MPALLGVEPEWLQPAAAYDNAHADEARPGADGQRPARRENGTNHVESRAGQQALQCVPYAREHSEIKITGDAWTWWDKAAGKYERGANPATGAVMVLFNYAGPAARPCRWWSSAA